MNRHMNRHMNWRRLLIAAAAAVLFGVLAPDGSPAVASSSGPCTGTVNGIDVSRRSATDPDDAITVGSHDQLNVVVTSAESIGRYSVQLGFAGFDWTVAEKDASGNSWTRSVAVGDYSAFGVGLYQVNVETAGSTPCTGAVLIRIAGSPFTTVAGWVALVLAAVGIGATAMVAVSGSARAPFGGMVLGAIGGLGAVGLIQQFAVAIPTRITLVIAIALGALMPLIAQQIVKLSGRGVATAVAR